MKKFKSVRVVEGFRDRTPAKPVVPDPAPDNRTKYDLLADQMEAKGYEVNGPDSMMPEYIQVCEPAVFDGKGIGVSGNEDGTWDWSSSEDGFQTDDENYGGGENVTTKELIDIIDAYLKPKKKNKARP